MLKKKNHPRLSLKCESAVQLSMKITINHQRFISFQISNGFLLQRPLIPHARMIKKSFRIFSPIFLWVTGSFVAFFRSLPPQSNILWGGFFIIWRDLGKMLCVLLRPLVVFRKTQCYIFLCCWYPDTTQICLLRVNWKINHKTIFSPKLRHWVFFSLMFSHFCMLLHLGLKHFFRVFRTKKWNKMESIVLSGERGSENN